MPIPTVKSLVSYNDPLTQATQRHYLQARLQTRVAAAAGNATLLRLLAEEADVLGYDVPELRAHRAMRLDRTLDHLKRTLAH